jgi:hypothetical protein
MTTNREEKLDAAFKRPGRVKSLRLDFLGFDEFKKMILYFHNPRSRANGRSKLTDDGHLPTTELWTAAIEQLGREFMADFGLLQRRHTSNGDRDLDRDRPGLSPALLEAACIEAETLQNLFELLGDELLAQWAKAAARTDGSDLPREPGVLKYLGWDWRAHLLRGAVLHAVRKQPAEVAALRAKWPEPKLADCVPNPRPPHPALLAGPFRFRPPAAPAPGCNGLATVAPSSAAIPAATAPAALAAAFLSDDVAGLARQVLWDEDKLNAALEHCRYLPDRNEFAPLAFKSEVWLGQSVLKLTLPGAPAAAAAAAGAGAVVGAGATLVGTMRRVASEVECQWRLAWRTEEEDIRERLGAEAPPSACAFEECFDEPLNPPAAAAAR